MRETEYTYAVAYTRTLENKMLKKTDMEMLINCNNIKSVEEFLIEKGYGSSNDYKKNIYDILKDEMIKIYNEIKFAVPRNSKIEMFLYPNDFHNLKTILKAVFSNTQWESVILEPYNVDPKLIFDAISTNQYNLLPEFIRQSAINAYEVLAKTQDGQLIEVMLDKDLFIILKSLVRGSRFIHILPSIINNFRILWNEFFFYKPCSTNRCGYVTITHRANFYALHNK